MQRKLAVAVGLAVCALLMGQIAYAHAQGGQGRGRGQGRGGVMGEYAGQVTTVDGEKIDLYAAVFPLGKGKWQITVLTTGTAEVDRYEIQADGTTQSLTFKTEAQGGEWTGKVEGRTMTAQSSNGDKAELQRFWRRSPTMGAEPPEGAVVLLAKENPNLDQWKNKAWIILPEQNAMRESQ